MHTPRAVRDIRRRVAICLSVGAVAVSLAFGVPAHADNSGGAPQMVALASPSAHASPHPKPSTSAAPKPPQRELTITGPGIAKTITIRSDKQPSLYQTVLGQVSFMNTASPNTSTPPKHPGADYRITTFIKGVKGTTYDVYPDCPGGPEASRPTAGGGLSWFFVPYTITSVLQSAGVPVTDQVQASPGASATRTLAANKKENVANLIENSRVLLGLAGGAALAVLVLLALAARLSRRLERRKIAPAAVSRLAGISAVARAGGPAQRGVRAPGAGIAPGRRGSVQSGQPPIRTGRAGIPGVRPPADAAPTGYIAPGRRPVGAPPVGAPSAGGPIPAGRGPVSGIPAAPTSSRPVAGSPGSGSPGSRNPASGVPVSGNPASGVPVSGSPGSTRPGSAGPVVGPPSQPGAVPGRPVSGSAASGSAAAGSRVPGVPGRVDEPVSGLPAGHVSPGPGAAEPGSGLPAAMSPADGPVPGASVSGGPASGVARGRATAPYGALAASGAAPRVNLPSGDVEPPTHSPTATGKAAVPTTPTAAGRPTASSGAIAPTSPTSPSGGGELSTEPTEKTTSTVPRTDGAGGQASDARVASTSADLGEPTTFFTLPHRPETAPTGDGSPAVGDAAATSTDTAPDATVAPGDSKPERADSGEHTTFFTLPHRPVDAPPGDGSPAAGNAAATSTDTAPDATVAPGDSDPERTGSGSGSGSGSGEHTTFFTLPRKPGTTAPESPSSDLTSSTESLQADGGAEATSGTVGRTANEAETVRVETASAEVPRSGADVASDATETAAPRAASRGGSDAAADETDVTLTSDANACETDVTPASKSTAAATDVTSTSDINAAETDVTPATDVAAAEVDETMTSPGQDAATGTAADVDPSEPTAVTTVPGSRKPEPDQATGGRGTGATTRTTGRRGKSARGRRPKTGAANGQVPSQAGPDRTDDSSTTAEDGAHDATAPRVPAARTPESSTSTTPAEAEPS